MESGTTRSMLRRAARILLIAVLMFTIGLHWVVLQSVAWAGMIVTYSVQEGSLITGVSQTFDSEHPCALCGAVQKGTQSESKDRKQVDPKKKLDLTLLAVSRVRLSPPVPRLMTFDVVQHDSQFPFRPPSPPPRRGGTFTLVG